MKKSVLLSLMTIVFCAVGFSQVKTKGLQTVAIKTPTVQCEKCKDRIEKYLIREEGVHKVTVDYKRGITKVMYYAERTNLDNVKTAIANIGYDADDITANEDSYAKLPNCCKKPEGDSEKKKN